MTHELIRSSGLRGATYWDCACGHWFATWLIPAERGSRMWQEVHEQFDRHAAASERAAT